MSHRPKRQTKSTFGKFDHLKESLSNKGSLLDSYEFEEDDVYDVVDEETYQKHVEDRRNAGDFVVDDDGAGYLDDGEEHLGIEEDEYDMKKRLKEEADELGQKGAKKAKRLAESSSATKNSMMSFVRTGQGMSNQKIGKEMRAKMVDIDSLMDEGDIGTKGSKSGQSKLAFLASDSSAAPPRPALPRPSLSAHSLHSSLRSTQSLAVHRLSQFSLFDTEEGGVGGGGGGEGGGGGDMDSNNDYDDHDRERETRGISEGEGRGGGEEVSSSSFHDIMSGREGEREGKREREGEREREESISLTKTSKKFSRPSSTLSASQFLPSQDDFSSSFSSSPSDPSSSSPSSSSSSSSSLDSMRVIDPSSWLLSLGEEDCMLMYWLDACELNGVLYLFGKVALQPSSSSSSENPSPSSSPFSSAPTTPTKGSPYTSPHSSRPSTPTPLTPTSPYSQTEYEPASASSPTTPTKSPSKSTSSSSSHSSAPRYVSCCVAVQGVEKSLYFLPRVQKDENGQSSFNTSGSALRIPLPQVHKEASSLLVGPVLPKTQGQLFKSRPVEKGYAFDCPSVPREKTQYLEVRYAAKYGSPPPSVCTQGGQTFEKIFGGQSSALESFILERRLLGPGWLLIRNPRRTNESHSWCDLEVAVERPECVSKLSDLKRDEFPDLPSEFSPTRPAPPLTALSISIKTVVNPSTHTHEVALLSYIVQSLNPDADTPCDKRQMKRVVLLRPLGVSCGPAHPATFPHDLKTEAVKHKDFLTMVPNERALLSLFFAKLKKEDPDVLASHNLFGFEFDVLLNRASVNKLNQMWSVLGRMKKTKFPRTINERDSLSGRLLCDTYKCSKEFLRETTYSLTALSASVLKQQRNEVDPVDVPTFYTSTKDLLNLTMHTLHDAFLVHALMLKLQVVPLTKQLTTVSGNLWSRTLKGARAERIEFLLLHEFHKEGYILPEKKGFGGGGGGEEGGDGKKGKGKASRSNGAGENIEVDDFEPEEEGGGGRGGGMGGRTRSKAAYAGGLVLEPKKGLYDTYILLMDFNSLYPSLIQEYNLCFTTINWTQFMGNSNPSSSSSSSSSPSSSSTNQNKKDKKISDKKEEEKDGEEEGEEEEEVNGEDEEEGEDKGMKQLPPLPSPSLPQGILPKVIKGLVDRRREVKNLLKKESRLEERERLDIRQKALKLTANSMYGCLGFSFSRFYARPIAALVTAKGREALQKTVQHVTNEGLDVIYGDTDSVMINTNCTDLAQVKARGDKIKSDVNKLYKCLELDRDGIFKSMLLLKKKKYAAISLEEETGPGGQVKLIEKKELKGLDLVRRDWCELSRHTGRYVVDQILSGRSREEIVEAIYTHLREVGNKVRASGITETSPEDREGKVKTEPPSPCEPYPLSMFVVTKGLSKPPQLYSDKNAQPHIQVALQMIKENKPVNVGDHIPYVICSPSSPHYLSSVSPSPSETSSPSSTTPTPTPSTASPSQRSHHPDEVLRSEGRLVIDVEWYLTNQLLPPISRLLSPIEETSPSLLAAQLGLDHTKYLKAFGGAEGGSGSGANEEDDWGFVPRSRMEEGEKYKDCDRLTCLCLACKQEFEYPSMKTQSELLNASSPSSSSHSFISSSSLFQCKLCGALNMGRRGAQDVFTYLSNRSQLLLRASLRRYYDCYLVCDDPSCHRRTQQQPVGMRRGAGAGSGVGGLFLPCLNDCHGRMQREYGEGRLYDQIQYLESLFSVEHLASLLGSVKPESLLPPSQTSSPSPAFISLPGSGSLPPEVEFLWALRVQTSQFLSLNAYNWIRPTLWSKFFGGKTKPSLSTPSSISSPTASSFSPSLVKSESSPSPMKR